MTTPWTENDLPDQLATRLRQPLPGRAGQRRFAPQLSYGRQFGPPARDARKAAVAVLLYPADGAWHIPLTLRPKDLAEHAGQVSFPGGAVETGESPTDAALREIHEELDVPSNSVRILGQLSPFYVFVTNYLVTPVVLACGFRPIFRPSPREVAQLLEVPLDTIMHSANYRTHRIVRGGVEFDAPHIAHDTYRVWGATGMMLSELITVLHDM